MKYRKLKGRIVEVCGSQREFCKIANIKTESLLSRKLNGLCAITQDDVFEWATILKIPAQDIGLYFFPQMFNENEATSQIK